MTSLPLPLTVSKNILDTFHTKYIYMHTHAYKVVKIKLSQLRGLCRIDYVS